MSVRRPSSNDFTRAPRPTSSTPLERILKSLELGRRGKEIWRMAQKGRTERALAATPAVEPDQGTSTSEPDALARGEQYDPVMHTRDKARMERLTQQAIAARGITDDDIRALRVEAVRAGDRQTVDFCNVALGTIHGATDLPSSNPAHVSRVRARVVVASAILAARGQR